MPCPYHQCKCQVRRRQLWCLTSLSSSDSVAFPWSLSIMMRQGILQRFPKSHPNQPSLLPLSLPSPTLQWALHLLYVLSLCLAGSGRNGKNLSSQFYCTMHSRSGSSLSFDLPLSGRVLDLPLFGVDSLSFPVEYTWGIPSPSSDSIGTPLTRTVSTS